MIFNRTSPFPTIIMVDIIKHLKPEATRILDLCTGEGFIAGEMKLRYPGAEIIGSDISQEEIDEANVRNPGIEYIQTDLFENITGKFDIIICDGPYEPSSVSVGEPRIAFDGGEDGMGILNRIIAESPNYLDQGGLLVLEIWPENVRLFEGWDIYPDHIGCPRFAIKQLSEGES